MQAFTLEDAVHQGIKPEMLAMAREVHGAPKEVTVILARPRMTEVQNPAIPVFLHTDTDYDRMNFIGAMDALMIDVETVCTISYSRHTGFKIEVVPGTITLGTAILKDIELLVAGANLQQSEARAVER
jgi:hypothetical protein